MSKLLLAAAPVLFLGFASCTPQGDVWLTRPTATPGHTPAPSHHSIPHVAAGVTGAWTSSNISFVSSTMLLLTDGRVLAQTENNQAWSLLTPAANGSYANGTWTSATAMTTARLYYASAVLADGRVAIFGGEYTGAAGETEDDTGEIYDPVANTWTPLTAPPGWTNIGDAPCAVLPDGRLLLGAIMNNATAIWDPATNTWADGGTHLGTSSTEESWVLLPNGSVLAVDCSPNRPQESELWVSGTGWVEGGALPVDLVETSSEEIGPALLLPDGRVMYFGATGHTAIYTPSPTLGQAGTWIAGPDLPLDATNAQVVTKDAPAVLLPNSHIIVSGSSEGSSGWGGPTNFYDVDTTVSPVTITAITAAPNNAQAPYEGRFLLLPDGEAVYSQGSASLSFLNAVAADGTVPAPSISTAPTQASSGSTFQVSGTGVNGVSQSVAYGDDASAATNYPLARLTDTSGNVYYARTSGHSTMAVATGSALVSTNVTIPASLASGTYSLQIVANAVASASVLIQISGTACGGCVDATGTCQAGTTTGACGSGGGACAVCVTNQSCVNGACQTAACTGCVDSTGTCQAGTDNAACGTGGAACVACATGQACTAGVCQTVACSGCVDSTGTCQAGTDNGACGTNGAACVACATGQSCLNGLCQTTACAGCVDATGTCQVGTDSGACGTGGAACVACATGQSCLNGLCQATTCAGCVDSSGTCQVGTDNGACGTRGVSCAACGSGQSCQNGICQGALCTGCIDATGTCQTGTTVSACGAGGSACSTCGAGQVCDNGACQAAVCGGCVDALGVCQLGTSDNACGAGGSSCVSCSASGLTCSGGQCAAGGCSHPICTSGAALVGSCDPCASNVCASDPYCCSTEWDSICVGEVGSICGETCF